LKFRLAGVQKDANFLHIYLIEGEPINNFLGFFFTLRRPS